MATFALIRIIKPQHKAPHKCGNHGDVSPIVPAARLPENRWWCSGGPWGTAMERFSVPPRTPPSLVAHAGRVQHRGRGGASGLEIHPGRVLLSSHSSGPIAWRDTTPQRTTGGSVWPGRPVSALSSGQSGHPCGCVAETCLWLHALDSVGARYHISVSRDPAGASLGAEGRLQLRGSCTRVIQEPGGGALPWARRPRPISNRSRSASQANSQAIRPKNSAARTAKRVLKQSGKSRFHISDLIGLTATVHNPASARAYARSSI